LRAQSIDVGIDSETHGETSVLCVLMRIGFLADVLKRIHFLLQFMALSGSAYRHLLFDQTLHAYFLA